MTIRERTEALVRADRDTVIGLAEGLGLQLFVMEQQPHKSTVMVPMVDPVHRTKFYIGETLVCACMVSLGDVKGHALMMGDDYEKVEAMAMIDAAFRAGHPACNGLENRLLSLREAQWEALRREAGLHHESRVDFETLEGQ